MPNNRSFYSTTTLIPNAILTPPIGGVGFSTAPTYPTVTCQQIGSQYVNHYWNETGGTSDDLDYNDIECSFNCTPVGGNGNGSGTVATVRRSTCLSR